MMYIHNYRDERTTIVLFRFFTIFLCGDIGKYCWCIRDTVIQWEIFPRSNNHYDDSGFALDCYIHSNTY
jgi:hypothetical protein